MPAFTAIALDSLIEPGGSKTMVAGKYAPDLNPERRSAVPSLNLQRVTSLPSSRLERGTGLRKPMVERSSVSTTKVNKKHHWTQISPALYATPEPTPLPDSPSSFPPSPYIINHKRRGPRLIKSFSVDDVAITRELALNDEKEAENAKNAEREVVNPHKDVEFTFDVPKHVEDVGVNGVSDEECGSNELRNGLAARNDSMNYVKFSGVRNADLEDFFDPQDSVSVKSNTEESSCGVEQSWNVTTPSAEFYDAWEELSSESGPLPSPMVDVEAELRGIRLSLLTEIENRKQAEETLNYMRSHWLKIQQQLSVVGLTLPSDPTDAVEGEQMDGLAEEVCQQVQIARFVSNSIGRGTAKAEVYVEMEAHLEAKNFEIARLWDRLHYYEAVNQEMSQRNQEVVETARRLRQSRKQKRKWIWGSVAAAITIGTAALAWSYMPSGKGSSSADQSDAPKGAQSAK